MITRLNFSAFEIYEDVMFCSNFLMNGLYYKNPSDKEFKFVDFFPGEKINVSQLHRSALLYENKIIFIPFNARNISIYNIDEKTFESIPVEKYGKEYNEPYLDENILWLIPNNLKFPIIKIDLKTNSINLMEQMNLQIKEYVGNLEDLYVVRIAIDRNDIYFAIEGTNTLVSINTKKKKIKCYSLRINNICFVCNGSNGLWIVKSEGNKIYHLEKDIEWKIDEYRIPSLSYNERSINYVLETHNRVIAIPSKGYDFYSLIRGEKEFTICHTLDKNQRRYNKGIKIGVKTLLAKKCKNEWIIPPVIYDSLIIIKDETDNNIEEHKVYLQRQEAVEKSYLENIGKTIYYEEEYIDLNMFIDLI